MEAKKSITCKNRYGIFEKYIVRRWHGYLLPSVVTGELKGERGEGAYDLLLPATGKEVIHQECALEVQPACNNGLRTFNATHPIYRRGMKTGKDSPVEKKIWPENHNSCLKFLFYADWFRKYTICLYILGTVSKGWLPMLRQQLDMFGIVIKTPTFYLFLFHFPFRRHDHLWNSLPTPA